MNIIDIFNNLELNCDKFEHYFSLYEQWFQRYVGKSPKILEIGVQHGGSAEMWRKYFGEGTQIVGVDINPLCNETEYLKLIVGDQGSEQFWTTAIANEHLRDFDIIIDDGSHNNPDQTITLKKTFNLLKDGGLYWCEDAHTSYYPAPIRNITDGGLKNPGNFIEYTKNIIDVINSLHTEYAVGFGKFKGPKVSEELINLYTNTQGIHFYDSIVVIEKRPKTEFKRLIHKRT